MTVVRSTRVCMLDFFCYSIQFYFLVIWDHGFHCGTLKLLEGH